MYIIIWPGSLTSKSKGGIFASPRSDIVQSIGRILRKKHETNPICWDIVYDFSVFPKQYTKRRA